ncbi:ECs1072 family phage-associated protein [Erwinia sp. V71]|uniref:ECs1072 family phage-associated protein n=1 Tax=Erwinia sp. V71 TaxID=3369424 RepID=UPI003F61F040
MIDNSEDFFRQIQKRIADHRGIALDGGITTDYYKVQNQAVLFFTLEAVLEEHRKKFATPANPLAGKQALHHLILQKYKWPLGDIRALSLQDALFVLQEDLIGDKLPESAKRVIKHFAAQTPTEPFADIDDREWDPILYQQFPKHW